jgi:hypothetical protein
MGDDKASRIGWGAMLAGDPLDRDDWQEALKQQSDRLHPWVTKAEARLILRSSLLDNEATANAAYERAKELINEVNGAMRAIRQTGIVRLDGVAEVLSDGRCRPVAIEQMVSAVRIREGFVATLLGADGKPKPNPEPRPSEVQRWLSIAAEDSAGSGDETALLSDALKHFARGDDWFEVYKALECLIQRFCGGNPKEFCALGWEDANDIMRLRCTATPSDTQEGILSRRLTPWNGRKRANCWRNLSLMRSPHQRRHPGGISERGRGGRRAPLRNHHSRVRCGRLRSRRQRLRRRRRRSHPSAAASSPGRGP